jgi:AraC family transcriptional regulator
MSAAPRRAPSGFSAAQTHGIALQPSNRLLAHSESLGWNNVYVSIAAERAWRGSLPPVEHMALAYCLGRSATVQRAVDGDGRAQTARLRPRLFGSIPANAVSHWQIDGSFDIALVYLRAAMLRDLAGDLFGLDPERLDVSLAIGTTDPLLEQLVLEVVSALRNPEACDVLYVDHVATMIGAHLLRRHAIRPAGCQSPFGPGAVAPSRSTQPGMWRVRDYIDANLDGDLGLDTLARAAGVSAAQFVPRFTAAHGETPHQFVIRRRVDRARQLLAGSDLPIADIALQTGFSSQSHLTDVFRRQIGEAPAAYRRTGVRPNARRAGRENQTPEAMALTTVTP